MPFTTRLGLGLVDSMKLILWILTTQEIYNALISITMSLSTFEIPLFLSLPSVYFTLK